MGKGCRMDQDYACCMEKVHAINAVDGTDLLIAYDLLIPSNAIAHSQRVGAELAIGGAS